MDQRQDEPVRDRRVVVGRQRLQASDGCQPALRRARSDINRARGSAWLVDLERTSGLKGTLEAITDWTFQWGADMGFGLTADHSPYDASAIKGFAFDITGTAPSTVKIVVEMPNIKNQYYREVSGAVGGRTRGLYRS